MKWREGGGRTPEMGGSACSLSLRHLSTYVGWCRRYHGPVVPPTICQAKIKRESQGSRSYVRSIRWDTQACSHSTLLCCVSSFQGPP